MASDSGSSEGAPSPTTRAAAPPAADGATDGATDVRAEWEAAAAARVAAAAEAARAATERRRAREEARHRARYLLRLRVLFPFLLVVVFLVYAFTTNFIPSASMEPTLKSGDHILAMRSWLAYPGGRMPARGDIVLFQPPESARREAGEVDDPDTAGFRLPPISLRRAEGEVWIKRVIGLPGDSILYREGRIYVNGSPPPARFLPSPPDPALDGVISYGVEEPLQLGKDELFVVGDNPHNSDDSRFWGPLERKYVIARFLCVVYHEGANGPNEIRARRELEMRHP
ncbi:MAG: signal peptidase I [Chthonomonadales bacterium]|nr:signal peptidase I [Chthonomonadales bacterium]